MRHAQTFASEQMLVSFRHMPQPIANGNVMDATDAQLPPLTKTCTQRLTQRVRYRANSEAPASHLPNLPAGQAHAQGMLCMTFKQTIFDSIST